MLLAVDIGNTSIALGIFEDEALVDVLRVASDKNLAQDEYEVLLKNLLRPYNVTDAIISSVVEELTEKVSNAVENSIFVKPMIVSNKLNIGISIKIDNPDELGADRIANAVGAYILYKHPVIVIDFGTATSFDIINSNGEFEGGVIAPGVNTQLNSLNIFTSRLPKIEAAVSSVAIGKNTTDAILSGVIRGSACMIDGLIKECEAELGQKAVVVATGGYASIVSKYLKHPFDYINPILIFDGLRYLYNLNKES